MNDKKRIRFDFTQEEDDDDEKAFEPKKKQTSNGLINTTDVFASILLKKWFITDGYMTWDEPLAFLEHINGEIDWSSEIIDFVADDWLKLENCGILWISSLNIILCEKYRTDPGRYYESTSGLYRGRVSRQQFPLLEPDLEEIPIDFSVLLFPIHQRTDSVEGDHWSLGVIFLKEFLEHRSTNRNELICYHFDSLGDYNLKKAQSYMNVLNKLKFFVRNSTLFQIKVKSVSGYPLQNQRICGPRILQCATFIRDLTVRGLLTPTILQTTIKHQELWMNNLKHLRAEMNDAKELFQYHQNYPSEDVSEETRYLLIRCLLHYREEFTIFNSQNLLEDYEGIFLANKFFPYVLCVDFLIGSADKKGSYLLVMIQPQHNSIIYWYSSATEKASRKIVDSLVETYQGVFSVITPIQLECLDEKTYKSSLHSAEYTWARFVRLCEYLIRFCYQGRLAPHILATDLDTLHSVSTEKGLRNFVKSQVLRLRNSRIFYNHSKKESFMPEDKGGDANNNNSIEILPDEEITVSTNLTKNIAKILDKTRSKQRDLEERIMENDVNVPVPLDYDPIRDAEGVDTEVPNRLSIKSPILNTYCLFIRNGKENILLSFREILALISNNADFFERAFLSNANSKAFVLGLTYEAPYFTKIIQNNTLVDAYVMHLHWTKTTTWTEKTWKTLKFIVDNWIWESKTDEEFIFHLASFLNLELQGLNVESLMISIIRLCILLASVPTE